MLDGKIALVTGAAQGMGAMHATVLAERGCHVIIADLDEVAGRALAEELCAGGYSASFHILDVTSETSWSAIIVDVMKRHGRVDVLVNNAGILIRAPLEDFAVEDLDRVLAVNVRGTFLGCKAVIAAMRAASGGSIINISSISGNIANMTGMTAYCASKGAVRMLTKAAALDLSKYGIRVNSIHPGTIETPMALKFLADPDTRREVLGTTIFQRAGLPREVSEVVAFLASDASSYMTGSEVAVDGGMGAT